MSRIALSCGDPSGIGPRLAVAVLKEPEFAAAEVLLTGPPQLWRGLGLKETARRTLIGEQRGSTEPGKPCGRGAEIQAQGLLQALDLVDGGGADALLTLPVNKAQLVRGGLPFAGHTELFRKRYPKADITMCFHAAGRWLGLASDHLPLRQVSAYLSAAGIAAAATALHRASGLPVALCGLNPHAGEDGLLGDDEMRLAPALAILTSANVPHRGFLPADGLFARWDGSEAILALYHDQGLAPFKALTAGRACQLSLGLPFVRSSPDHGTAYDLAAAGGDPGSVRLALRAALHHQGGSAASISRNNATPSG